MNQLFITLLVLVMLRYIKFGFILIIGEKRKRRGWGGRRFNQLENVIKNVLGEIYL